jgi:hypothetical protein
MQIKVLMAPSMRKNLGIADFPFLEIVESWALDRR